MLIKNGRVLDPSENLDGELDLYIVDGVISDIGKGLEANADETIDATGKLVVPGLIDIHVHLREPGGEAKETIKTGSRSAAAGGFTTVCCMPNTNPVLDSATGVNYVRAVAARDSLINVHPIAAVTKGQLGKEITEFGDLRFHGAVAFSDDGMPVYDAEIMRLALEYTAMLNMPIMNHSEIPELVGEGVAHHGRVAMKLGLRGVPRAAETASVARDIELAAETGGHVHICHVSTARACELIAEAKQRGIRVTAEVTPHHLLLTDQAIETFSTMARVAPPLRGAEDRDALRQALRNGTLDCIATDHAPHTDIEKNVPFQEAPPGMIGLDFSWALMYHEMVGAGVLTLSELVARMTIEPAKVLNLSGGSLAKGRNADVTIIDLEGTTQITRETIKSKSCNTPFLGKQYSSKIETTIVKGRVVYSNGQCTKLEAISHP